MKAKKDAERLVQTIQLRLGKEQRLHLYYRLPSHPQKPGEYIVHTLYFTDIDM
jgi:hypothetical protein